MASAVSDSGSFSRKSERFRSLHAVSFELHATPDERQNERFCLYGFTTMQCFSSRETYQVDRNRPSRVNDEFNQSHKLHANSSLIRRRRIHNGKPADTLGCYRAFCQAIDASLPMQWVDDYSGLPVRKAVFRSLSNTATEY